MSHFHSYLQTKDMDKTVIKQQAFSWPATLYQLKALIPPLHPTVVKELVSSRLLESNMSPTQFRAWKNEVQANSAFFTKFSRSTRERPKFQFFSSDRDVRLYVGRRPLRQLQYEWFYCQAQPRFPLTLGFPQAEIRQDPCDSSRALEPRG